MCCCVNKTGQREPAFHTLVVTHDVFRSKVHVGFYNVPYLSVSLGHHRAGPCVHGGACGEGKQSESSAVWPKWADFYQCGALGSRAVGITLLNAQTNGRQKLCCANNVPHNPRTKRARSHSARAMVWVETRQLWSNSFIFLHIPSFNPVCILFPEPLNYNIIIINVECVCVFQDRTRPFDPFNLVSLENSLMDMIRTDQDKGKAHPAGGPPVTIADIIWRNHFAG